MAPLTLQELQKAQAIVDGFANGPLPSLNSANLNVQALEGNPIGPGTTFPTKYPPAGPTPFLHLSTFDMSTTLAMDMWLIDRAFGNGSSINVNGVLVQHPNLNNTTPVAPAGYTNVIFQVDSNGNISAYYSASAPSSSAWAALTGDLTETQVIPFDGPTVGTPDTGISRIGVDSLAIGDGVSGNTSGSLTLSNLFASTVDTVTLSITGELLDSTGSSGTAGQVLESTVTGTLWTTVASIGGYLIEVNGVPVV
jgi:hypothetical protein